MLDIIAEWNTNENIPNTTRGQPKKWTKSSYNSITHAKDAFDELIKNTNSEYILISYNNKGIIKQEVMENILKNMEM